MRGQRTIVKIEDVDWRVFKRLIPYLFAFRKRIAIALMCLVAAKIATVAIPFILKHIIDKLNTTESVLTYIPLALLLSYGAARFAIVLFGELRDMLFGRVTESVMRKIGLEVFRHVHNLDLDFHLNRQTGGLSRDIERGINGISFLLRFLVFNIIPTLLEFAFVLIVLLLNYSASYAFIVFCSIISYIVFSIFATEWRTRYVRKVNQAESASSSRAIDSLLNYETVKYFNNEAYEANCYNEELLNWEKARGKNRITLFVLNSGQSFIIALAMTLSLIIAAWEVTKGVITIGDFVLINTFIIQVFMPLNFLGFVYRELKGSLVNIENVFALLNRKSTVVDHADDSDLIVTNGNIRFENVDFHYSQERKILKKISFEAKNRQKIAIVGDSGAGKSTIFKLLFRFYNVNHGNIFIDKQDISQVSLLSLRQAIAVVPQETVLFNTTIYENIRYGNITASSTDIEKAIAMANLSDFIASLPDKAQTLVGERGLKLSGGEKQRIAIARAVLKNAPIMIFDEATSSLDSHSEKQILTAIEAIRHNYTSIFIAHRLSTIKDADNIIVLREGQILETGTHDELLNKRGHYTHLWGAQQKTREKY